MNKGLVIEPKFSVVPERNLESTKVSTENGVLRENIFTVPVKINPPIDTGHDSGFSWDFLGWIESLNEET